MFCLLVLLLNQPETPLALKGSPSILSTLLFVLWREARLFHSGSSGFRDGRQEWGDQLFVYGLKVLDAWSVGKALGLAIGRSLGRTHLSSLLNGPADGTRLEASHRGSRP